MLRPRSCLLAVLCSACALAPHEVVEPAALLGTWSVDLRPTPDAEPYFQELVISKADARTFAGTFYGAPVTQARVNADWGTLRIAFVTSDGSGEYHHSAVLERGALLGMSNSTGRDFLARWRAEKAESPPTSAR